MDTLHPNQSQPTYPLPTGFTFASDPPIVRRQPSNKSGKGTHLTFIKDVGECGPVIYCCLEYTAKHCPAEQTLDIEVGCVTEVYSVKLQWRENGHQNYIETAVDFNEKMVARHCDYLLNCYTDIEDRIADEIRQSLTN